jgi:hypothetical protein
MVTVCYTEDGKEKLASERLDLPPDVANGLILTLLKNVPRKTQQLTVSMVAATPKPRLVKLAIAPAGEESFSIGGSTHQATRYVLKVEIGGVAGVVAPLVGKQPPDVHVWIQGGTAPGFVKMQGPLYSGGPMPATAETAIHAVCSSGMGLCQPPSAAMSASAALGPQLPGL